jgi:HptB-dependent secretion and biofilm anti anti-sigma factor
MTLKKHVSEDKSTVTISITDRFDFSLHLHFRDSYTDCNKSGSEIIIDLSQTTYMDSSALGMILLLKDHVESIAGKLKISKPNDAVNKILEIAQFHRLMTIEK